ncbi:MAG: response regulator transcription factor [Hyphomicrobiaceae bacterium]
MNDDAIGATNGATKAKPPLPDDAPHIIIVDDDDRIRSLLARFLHDRGYRVSSAGDVASARSAMKGLAFDLVILDVMLPDMSGFEFARELRRDTKIPILMLTARTEIDARLEGLEAGVDDYLAKPFDPRELLLRLNNILRRRDGGGAQRDEVRIGDFTFHVGRGELRRGEETVKLTERERDLLRLFAQRPGATIPRHELIVGDQTGSERAVDVQINRLRRKIEIDPANPVFLQTVRGRGYILHTQ